MQRSLPKCKSKTLTVFLHTLPGTGKFPARVSAFCLLGGILCPSHPKNALFPRVIVGGEIVETQAALSGFWSSVPKGNENFFFGKRLPFGEKSGSISMLVGELSNFTDRVFGTLLME